nr:Chain P, Nuclear receptor coactivator 2 [synthetic construct]1ZDU_Q Chain Q, Nuclear receptor coactivator 2 [synthetic construct]3E7C_D Chain D, Nuclear receptor coactivator 2 [Homo sapiens]3E7C_H Chain H, Nuclear receptor coactivator 2 [Homo sapiens]5YXB_B Chain B, Peptide from Nuclear receptor coactivator 2 [Homo sapiens]5YXJ_C Chain C, Peptide from Nuclear receptor coactivator 2 [Homo sapiens]5YXJ_D Chain D, Peptide from Nuclear receptor coactivator 2 [Homo sapiens]6KKB_D Chain D, SRC2
ENALLRYLLDK